MTITAIQTMRAAGSGFIPPAELRAWQAHMGYTYDTAANALGMSRSGFAKLLAGDHPIDKRTALACAAIAAGLDPWPSQAR